MGNSKKWTEEEIAILKQYYPDIKKIQELINRSKTAIRSKAIKFKLNPLKQSLCFSCKYALKCPWVLLRERIWRSAEISHDNNNGVITTLYKVLECDYYGPET